MSTVTFRLNNDGEMRMVGRKREVVYNEPKPVKKVSKLSDNYAFSFAPIGVMAVGNAIANTSGAGIFWDTFMTYIFPWMIDIAKVFCAIKIAQAFYQERRGGRDGGTGMEAIVTYGKWYLLFILMPWAVELIDELGSKMLLELKGSGGV